MILKSAWPTDRVPGQPGLHGETLSQKTKEEEKKDPYLLVLEVPHKHSESPSYDSIPGWCFDTYS